MIGPRSACSALLLLAPGRAAPRRRRGWAACSRSPRSASRRRSTSPCRRRRSRYEIMWHVNETLFTYDAGFNPVPLLAETHTVTDGGRRTRITLRKGVKFHNGKEMTSADVVPSLKRWGPVASLGKTLWANVESVEAKDPYTVVIRAQAAVGLAAVRPGRAARAPSIPRRSSRPPATGQLKEYIGTGPVSASSSTSPTGTSSWRASRTTPRAASRRAASAASAWRTSTRSCSSPCRIPRSGWPAWRPASTTTRCS